MQRRELIERCLRFVYGGFPTDDATITNNLVNSYINDGVALVAKQNYKENYALDGISYVNNSFYARFKNLPVTFEEKYLYRIIIPQIPLGIGRNEAISTLQFKDGFGNNLSYPCIPLSEAQRGYFQTLKPIPNKTLWYPEGQYAYVISTINLTQYTALVVMVSGGDKTDLTSTLNVPDDYIQAIQDYVIKMLMAERQQPVDAQNDGLDARSTT